MPSDLLTVLSSRLNILSKQFQVWTSLAAYGTLLVYLMPDLQMQRCQASASLQAVLPVTTQ